MTPTIHVTTGLPASGKTTRALELLADAKGRMRRVNLDDIRAMLDGPNGRDVWSRQHERTAHAVQEAAVRAALADGFDVVVDNTHLAPRSLAGVKKAAAGQGVEYVVHDFTRVPVEECIRRDAARERPVGEEVIRRLHNRHRSATRSGWRLTAEWLNDGFVPAPYVPDASLPAAVMCDIDGTLALNDGRGPYEFERCGEDLLNAPVAHTLAMYAAAGHRVVLLSGRGEEYRPHTEEWLARHQVAFDELWMRAAGDMRRDDVVKAELFDAHIRHRFAVRVTLDDRDRCIALWRMMGLPTWQVNYGDF